MANIAKPQRDEIIAHNLNFGRGEEDRDANKCHEQIEVAQLQGQNDAAWRDGNGLLFRNLLRSKPGRIADGAEVARQAGPSD